MSEKQVAADDGYKCDTRWKHINMEKTWHFLGRFGKYQAKQILLQRIIYVVGMYPTLSGLFTGKAVDSKCVSDIFNDSTSDNQTIDFRSSHVELLDNTTSKVLSKEPCTKYDYGHGGTLVSYIAEWDLVSDKEALGQLPQILLMAGMAVGSISIPRLGDRFGRRKLVVVCLSLQFIVVFLCVFVEQFEFFVLLKFLTGVINMGAIVPNIMLGMEIVPIELRSWVGLSSSTCWVFNMMLTGTVGYILQDAEWRTLQLTYTLLSSPAIFVMFFLDESLPWLVTNGRIHEADVILRKACRMNNKDYDTLVEEVQDVDGGVVDGEGKGKEGHKSRKYNFLDIVRNKNMRMISLILLYGWFICALTYYGIMLMSTSLDGDPYLNFFLTAGVEFPGTATAFYLISRFGRKLLLISTQLISAVALIISVLITYAAPSGGVYTIIKTTFTLIGQLCISGTFEILWVFTPELFPTNLRGNGVGMSLCAAKISASLSPLFIILSRYVPWAPGAIFGIGGLISVVLITQLPETRWRELPETIEEVDMWFENKEIKNKSIENENEYFFEKGLSYHYG